MHLILVLKARSAKSRHGQGHTLSKASRENLPLPLPMSGGSGGSLASSCIAPPLHLSPPGLLFPVSPLLSVSGLPQPFCYKMSSLISGRRAQQIIQDDFTLRSFIISVKTLSPHMFNPQVVRVSTWIYTPGSHHSTHHTCLPRAFKIKRIEFINIE